MSDNILVVLRIRPLIPRECKEDCQKYWQADQGVFINQIDPDNKKAFDSYKFDKVFDCHINNEDIYNAVAIPIVESVLAGINGTIFAYGQTSSGKTFTMTGTEESPGIIPLYISDIFQSIENTPNREFLLRASYMEIYLEDVYDLLTGSKLGSLREDTTGAVHVPGLKEVCVTNEDMLLSVMADGDKRRKVAETKMNERSSRSHSIFRLILESRQTEDSDGAVTVSHLNLVDLAGSENASQTGNTGERLKEGGSINKSLCTLSRVIYQLSVGENFVSFRDSKLTRILQMSLGGNAKTVMICTVTSANREQTLSTIRFALHAKSVQNRPIVNEVLSDAALLKRYAIEIKKLTEALENERKTDKAHEVEQVKERLDEQERQNQELQAKLRSLKEKLIVPSLTKYDASNKERKMRRETWAAPLMKQGFTPFSAKVPKPPFEMQRPVTANLLKTPAAIQKLSQISEEDSQPLVGSEIAASVEQAHNSTTSEFHTLSESFFNEEDIEKMSMSNIFPSPKVNVAPKKRRKCVNFVLDNCKSLLPIFRDIECQTDDSLLPKPQFLTHKTPNKEACTFSTPPGVTPRATLRSCVKELSTENETLLKEYDELQGFQENEIKFLNESYQAKLNGQPNVEELKREVKSLQLSLSDAEVLYLDARKAQYDHAEQMKTSRSEIEALILDRDKYLKELTNVKETTKLSGRLEMTVREQEKQIKSLEMDRADFDLGIELAVQKQKQTEKYLRSSLEEAWADIAKYEGQKPEEVKSQALRRLSLEKKLEVLQEEVKSLKSKEQDYIEQVQSIQSDFETYKLKVIKEQQLNGNILEQNLGLKGSSEGDTERLASLASKDSVKDLYSDTWSINQTNKNIGVTSPSEITNRFSDTIQALQESLLLSSPKSDFSMDGSDILNIRQLLLRLQEVLVSKEWLQTSLLSVPDNDSVNSYINHQIEEEYLLDVRTLNFLESFYYDYFSTTWSDTLAKKERVSEPSWVSEESFIDEMLFSSLNQSESRGLSLADELKMAVKEPTAIDETESMSKKLNETRNHGCSFVMDKLIMPLTQDVDQAVTSLAQQKSEATQTDDVDHVAASSTHCRPEASQTDGVNQVITSLAQWTSEASQTDDLDQVVTSLAQWKSETNQTDDMDQVLTSLAKCKSETSQTDDVDQVVNSIAQQKSVASQTDDPDQVVTSITQHRSEGSQADSYVCPLQADPSELQNVELCSECPTQVDPDSKLSVLESRLNEKTLEMNNVRNFILELMEETGVFLDEESIYSYNCLEHLNDLKCKIMLIVSEAKLNKNELLELRDTCVNLESNLCGLEIQAHLLQNMSDDNVGKRHREEMEASEIIPKQLLSTEDKSDISLPNNSMGKRKEDGKNNADYYKCEISQCQFPVSSQTSEIINRQDLVSSQATEISNQQDQISSQTIEFESRKIEQEHIKGTIIEKELYGNSFFSTPFCPIEDLREKDKELKELRDICDNLRGALNKRKKDMEESESVYEEKIITILQSLASEEKRVSDLEICLKMKEERLTAMENMLNAVTNKKEPFESKISALEEAANQNASIIEALSKEKLQAELRIDTLNQEMTTLKSDYEISHSQLTHLVTDFKSKCEIHEAELKFAADSHTAIKRELETIRECLDLKEKLVKKLEEELDNFKDEHGNCAETLIRQNKEVEKLQKMVDECKLLKRTRLDQVLEECEIVKSEISENKRVHLEEVKKLEEERDALVILRQAVNEDLFRMKTELKNLLEELNISKLRSSKFEELHQKSTARSFELQEELKVLKKKSSENDDTKEKFHLLEVQKNKIESDLHDMASQLAEKTASYEALSKELDDTIMDHRRFEQFVKQMKSELINKIKTVDNEKTLLMEALKEQVKPSGKDESQIDKSVKPSPGGESFYLSQVDKSVKPSPEGETEAGKCKECLVLDKELVATVSDYKKLEEILSQVSTEKKCLYKKLQSIEKDKEMEILDLKSEISSLRSHSSLLRIQSDSNHEEVVHVGPEVGSQTDVVGISLMNKVQVVENERNLLRGKYKAMVQKFAIFDGMDEFQIQEIFKNHNTVLEDAAREKSSKDFKELYYQVKRENDVLSLKLAAQFNPALKEATVLKELLEQEKFKNKQMMQELRRIQNKVQNEISVCEVVPQKKTEQKIIPKDDDFASLSCSSQVVMELEVMRLKNINYHLNKEKSTLEQQNEVLNQHLEHYKGKAKEWKTKCFKESRLLKDTTLAKEKLRSQFESHCPSSDLSSKGELNEEMKDSGTSTLVSDSRHSLQPPASEQKVERQPPASEQKVERQPPASEQKVERQPPASEQKVEEINGANRKLKDDCKVQ